MKILIERDNGATRVAKDVAGLDDARAYQAQGFTVHLLTKGDDGEDVPVPLPQDDEPAAAQAGEAEKHAAPPPAAKATKTKKPAAA